MRDLELLGLTVRDKVTGMTGVCSSISYDLYGCIQAVVSPEFNAAKNELPSGVWLDVSRLEVVDATPVMNVPGGRFVITRSANPTPSANVPGPAEKPAR